MWYLASFRLHHWIQHQNMVRKLYCRWIISIISYYMDILLHGCRGDVPRWGGMWDVFFKKKTRRPRIREVPRSILLYQNTGRNNLDELKVAIDNFFRRWWSFGLSVHLSKKTPRTARTLPAMDLTGELVLHNNPFLSLFMKSPPNHECVASIPYEQGAMVL